MKIGLASDHRGYKLKEYLKEELPKLNYEVVDFGTNSEISTDYPDYAFALGEAIVSAKVEKGVAICGSGIGISIACNKVKGIRCATCYSEESAKFAKLHNDINVLALGAEYLSNNEAICILRMILATEFEGGRHNERLNLIKEIEKENMK